MALVPQGLASLEAAFAEGVQQGIVAAQRQAAGCAKQADVWGGVDSSTAPFFVTLVDEYDASGIDNGSLRDALERHADRATRRTRHSGATSWRSTCRTRPSTIPSAASATPCTRATSTASSSISTRRTRGAGRSSVASSTRCETVAERIIPGATVDEVIAHLESDPTRAIEGVDEFRRWNQELLDSTVAALNGVHFDIPAPVQQVEAMIAPPGGAAAMYYTGPSEDFSRPGRTWYPTLGKTRFPLWGEVSICYHEGVPGHHLQIAQVRYLAELAQPLPAHAGRHVGPRGGLGAVRGATHGRARLPRRSRLRARHAARAGDAGGACRRRHRHAPRARDPRRSATTPARRGHPSSRSPSSSSAASSPRTSWRARSIATSGSPGRPSATRSASVSGSARATTPGARAASAFDLKTFHRIALDAGPMGLAQLERELARI